MATGVPFRTAGTACCSEFAHQYAYEKPRHFGCWLDLNDVLYILQDTYSTSKHFASSWSLHPKFSGISAPAK